MPRFFNKLTGIMLALLLTISGFTAAFAAQTVEDEPLSVDAQTERATTSNSSEYLYSARFISADQWVHNGAGTLSFLEDGVIRLGGGGSLKYNKILSKQSYSGDFSLSFDVKFSSNANEEMFFFSPRYNPASLDLNRYTNSAYCNFVLHTTTSGLRMGRNGSNNVLDTSMTDLYNDQKIDCWFTVKLVIEGDEYKCKYWPSEQAEPSEWNCTYTYASDKDCGPISFSKRGKGTLDLQNIRVEYNSVDTFIATTVDPVQIGVPFGTKKEDLVLPATVQVASANGAFLDCDVEWDYADYNPQKSGQQTIYGEIQLEDSLNPNRINAVAVVDVALENAVYYTSKIWARGENADVNVYHQFGTTKTKAGTILATCEARVGGGDANNPSKIVLKRSEDGGITWGDTIVVADYAENPCSEKENDCGKNIYGHFYANPTPIVDYTTGKILLFYSENFGNTTAKLYYKVSVDDGKTWSAATEVTHLFDDDPHTRAFHLPGPGHGIQIRNGPYTGRLIVEVWHRHGVSNSTTNRQYGLSALYSDDGGATWQNSDFIEIGYNMNEGRVAEIAGGVLVINSRSTDDTRKQTYSVDGGVTWSTPTTWTSIGSYANCDSGFASYVTEQGTELVTVHQFGTDNRDNLYAFISYDNGKTWDYSKKIWSKNLNSRGTGASDTYLLDAHTYGVIYGTAWGNNDVEYVVFNTSYIANVEEPAEILKAYSCEAQIGIQNYDTLSEAVASADAGDTVLLRQSVLSEQDLQLDKELYLDLNGFSLWTEEIDALCAEGYFVTYLADMELYHIQKGMVGDLNQDNVISDADALYLLMHTFFPSVYPVNQDCDFNKDTVISDADAQYVLLHTFFPSQYPID